MFGFDLKVVVVFCRTEFFLFDIFLFSTLPFLLAWNLRFKLVTREQSQKRNNLKNTKSKLNNYIMHIDN